MKHFLKSHSLTWLSLGAGAAGLLLRLWLFHTGVDEKGLLVSGHPADTLSYILIAITIAGLFLLPRFLGFGAGSFGALPAAVGNLAAAAGILYAGICSLNGTSDPIALFVFLLNIPAAIGCVYSAWCKLQKKPDSVLLQSLITVFLVLYPVSQYRLLSTQPQLQYYFFQVLAAVFLMFTAYLRTSLANGSRNEKKCVFCRHTALFLCLMCLADENRLFYLAMALWLVTDCGATLPQKAKSPEGTMPLPKAVRYVIRALEIAGFEAYAVGGCVRDHLLGLTPHDYDLCTSATPDKIAEVFATHALVRNGEKHGTIGVVIDHQVYEVTTFRTEDTYSDSRHPDKVDFVTSVEEDLRRRDFTVNAMAYSPKKGFIDPWGGKKDLEDRVLRAVGDPETRFTEDALRILRGVRFAVRFQLMVEERTALAMQKLAPRMEHLAKERVFDELCKLLPLVKAVDLIRFKDILLQIIPELAATVDFDQHSPHHAYDVFTHTAHVVEAAPNVLSLRWAALLHDVEKPGVFTQDENGRGHFYGHAEASAKTADAVLRRLKAPNSLREQAVWLIEHHMLPLEPDKKQLRRRLGKYGRDDLFALLALQRADFSSKGIGTAQEDPCFDQVDAMLEELLEENACLTVSDLAITGRDILALGYEPGPQIGRCMTFLLDKVHDEVLPNDKKELLAAADVFLDREI